jgi:hypothetical protein
MCRGAISCVCVAPSVSSHHLDRQRDRLAAAQAQRRQPARASATGIAFTGA